jgi:hypothetical protein
VGFIIQYRISRPSILLGECQGGGVPCYLTAKRSLLKLPVKYVMILVEGKPNQLIELGIIRFEWNIAMYVKYQ